MALALEISKGKGNAEGKRAAAALPRAGELAAFASRMPDIALVDAAIIDRRHSRSGLYSLERGAVKPLRSLEECAAGAKILARTDGLSSSQLAALAEQNVGIVHVRELPGMQDMCGILSSPGSGDAYGTRVVPYLVLGPQQAQKLENLANAMPEPPEAKKRDVQADAGSGKAACFAPYGGC